MTPRPRGLIRNRTGWWSTERPAVGADPPQRHDRWSGSVAGSESAPGKETVENDATSGERQWSETSGGKKKKAQKQSGAEKAEFIADLLKIAPAEMIEAILELPEEDQEAAAEVAADHAADLLA
jgi:hypothetical protein